MLTSAEDDYRHGIYDPRFNTWVDLLDDKTVQSIPKAHKSRKARAINPDVIPPEPTHGRVKSTTKRLSGRARINQILRLMERDGSKCKWCEVALSLEVPDPSYDTCTLRHPTIDHYPRRKVEGGDNSDANAVLACQDCNTARESPKHVSRWSDCGE